MLIEKRSQISGKLNSMEIPATELEITTWYHSGKAIQEVLPHLNADQREFLMTGITPEEWSKMFG
jgi:hypothetical protein